jgi:hypothetical protein
MNFERVTSKYPSERAAIARLGKLLDKYSGQRTEYSLNRLCDELMPNNREVLASALGELVRQGTLKLVFRVLSPGTEKGIKDFESLDQIPEVIDDTRTGLKVEVRPENLKPVYVAPAHDAA